MLADLNRDTGVDDRVVGVGDEQARVRARGDRDRVRHPVRPGHLGTCEQARVERAQRDGNGLRVPVLGSRRFRLGGHALGRQDFSRQDFGEQTGADRPGGRARPGGIVGCGEHDRHEHRGGQDQDQPVPLFPEPAELRSVRRTHVSSRCHRGVSGHECQAGRARGAWLSGRQVADQPGAADREPHHRVVDQVGVRLAHVPAVGFEDRMPPRHRHVVTSGSAA